MTSGVVQTGKEPQTLAPALRTAPRCSLLGGKAVARVAREAAAAAVVAVAVGTTALLPGGAIAHLLTSTWLPFRAPLSLRLDQATGLLREAGTRCRGMLPPAQAIHLNPRRPLSPPRRPREPRRPTLRCPVW